MKISGLFFLYPLGILAMQALPFFAATAEAQEAFSLPVSDDVFEGFLKFPGDEEEIYFIIREGSMVKVREAEEHRFLFGFLVRGGNGVNSFIWLMRNSADGEAVVEVPSPITAKIGDSVPIGEAGIFLTLLKKVTVAFSDSAGQTLDLEAPEGQVVLSDADSLGFCCMLSGGVFVCSSSVMTVGGGFCCVSRFCRLKDSLYSGGK